jgi:hypothetical protein
MLSPLIVLITLLSSSLWSLIKSYISANALDYPPLSVLEPSYNVDLVTFWISGFLISYRSKGLAISFDVTS